MSTAIWRTAVAARNSIAWGRRYAALSIALQLAATVLLALLMLPVGVPVAAAVLCGGGAVALGNLLLAATLFAPGVVGARRALRGAWAGLGLKLLVLLLVLYLAFAVLQLALLPLLAGMLAAQAAFWVGLVFIR